MEIQKSATIIMVPFYLDNPGREEYLDNKGPWEVIPMDIQRGYLYTHIHKVLQSSVNQSERTDNHSFHIYSLKKGSILEKVANSVKCMSHGNQKWTFRILNEVATLLSPKLIVCPDTEVGMLMLPVQLLSEASPLSHADLMTFNYFIQKAKEGSAPRLQNTDDMVVNKSYTIPLLVRDLLQSIIGGYHLFNENRYHLFTYVQIRQSDLLQMDDDACDNFIRICKNQTADYQPAENDRENTITPMFNNIYVGSSVEGSAIMMLSKGTSFDDNYLTDAVEGRFLWIYILAFMQRISLIAIHRGLSDKQLFGSNGNSLSLTELREESEKIIRMKVNTYFSDVSDYSQHNTFYQFCRKRLGVNRLFDELDDKMTQLDKLLSQKSDKVRESNQLWIAIVVGIMAALSAANDLTDLMAKIFSLEVNSPVTIVTSCVILFGMVALGCWVIWKFHRQSTA